MGTTMLALLSAPRGRVNAARIATRAQDPDPAPAFGIIIRIPRTAAPDAAPVRAPRPPRLAEAVR